MLNSVFKTASCRVYHCVPNIFIMYPRMIVFVFFLWITSSLCQSDSIDKTLCGRNRTCFGFPPDCIDSRSRDCEILFSAYSDASGKSVRMELLAKLDDSSNKWFAVAFSDDTSMGDDAVFECLVLESQTVDLRQSYNSGKSNRLVPDSSGTSSVRMSLKNGNVYCSWKQNSILNIRSKSLDLINKQYHLMLARGPFRSSTVKSYHNDRIVSSEKLSLKTAALVSSAPTSLPKPVSLIKTHGCLMIISWIICASIGIMIARHFKDAFGDDEDCCGTKVWFCFHRTLMSTVVVLVFIALYCSYDYVGGWSGPHLHPLLGVSTVVCMIIQVIVAQCRCHPEHESRWIFNWFHFLTGNSAHILSVASLFTAYEAIFLPKTFLYLMIAFVIFHVILHGIIQCKRDYSDDDSQDMAMNGTIHPFQVEIKRVKGNGFKKFFLAVYSIGVICLAVALILTVLDKIK